MSGAKPDLASLVRTTVLSLAKAGVVILPSDVAARVGAEGGEVAQVQAAIRAIHDSGALAKLGYARRLVQERTAQGVITMVAYAPRGRPRGSEALGSRAPTRTPHSRPLAGLNASARVRQRVDRQARALAGVMSKAQAEMMRAGEQLLAIEGLVGKKELRRYVERELGMSPRTAGRLMRVALIFGGHPAAERLWLARPSILIALSDPKFPADRREAILAHGGLEVRGQFIELKDLKVSDLAQSDPRPPVAERDRELWSKLQAWSGEPTDRGERARRIEQLEAILARLRR